MHFDSFSFINSSLFSIRELIGVITSNYRLVGDNFISLVILFKSPVFHDTFWTNKVSLSSTNQGIFYIFNCLHFTSFWWFYDMMTVEDSKILMRDICIICRDLRSFLPPPSVEPLALSFGSMSLTTISDFFLLMIFMLLCRMSSISFFSLLLVFFSLV